MSIPPIEMYGTWTQAGQGLNGTLDMSYTTCTYIPFSITLERPISINISASTLSCNGYKGTCLLVEYVSEPHLWSHGCYEVQIDVPMLFEVVLILLP